MLKKIFHFPQNISSKARRALILTAFFLIGMLGVTVLLTVQVVNEPVLQRWIILAITLVEDIFLIVGLIYIVRDRYVIGVWLAYGVWLFQLIVITAMMSGMGLIFMVSAIAVSTLIAGQTLSARSLRAFIILGTATGVFCYLLDSFLPAAERVTITALTPVAYILIGILLLIFIVFSIFQFPTYSLRTKQVVALLGISLFVMITFGVISTLTSRAQTIKGVGQFLQAEAKSQGQVAGDFLASKVDGLTVLGYRLNDAAAVANASYTGTSSEIQQEIERLDQQWIAADQAGNNNDALVFLRLNNPTASILREFRQGFPDNVEVFLTDQHGALVASTNRTSDYNQADEAWWQAAYDNGAGKVYIGEMEFDESSQTFATNIAIPIYSANSRNVIGVLRTTVSMQALVDSLAISVQNVEGAQTVVIFPSDNILVGNTLELMGPAMQLIMRPMVQSYAEIDFQGVKSFASASYISSTNAAVNEAGWLVMIHQDSDIALAPINTQIRTIVLVGMALAAVAVGLAFLVARALVQPVLQLTTVAEKAAAGDLTVEAKVTSTDEVGKLASTFNSMTRQIRDLIERLEQRVAERTRALATVAEVSTAASTILETDKLLQEVVNLSKERFNFYHAHIYLLNEAGDTLVLASGAGEPGQQMVAKGHSIPLDREHSLVARAARERKGVTVNDVTQEPDFLPNPLLPDTRSELAVPMIVGETVMGVFDVQSDVVGRFTDSDISIQTTLAAQIASAIQNASLYARAEASKQEAQSLVNYASEAILVLDLNTGLFTEPNESASKLYGMPREELLKIGPAQVSPPTQPDGRDSTEKALENINVAMQTGTAVFDWIHRNAQGQDIDCEIRLVRLPGTHPRLRVTVTDITQRKRLEQLTAQRARQQEALNQITQKIQSTTTVEAALQIAARELGHAMGQKSTLVTLENPSTSQTK